MKRFVTLIALVCMTIPAVALQADTSDVSKQIVGAWQLKMTTPDGEHREPIVLIGRQYDAYVAWYVGNDGPEAMKNVQLKNDLLVGAIEPKEQPGMTVTLEARLQGEGACEGVGKYKSTYGDSGNWKFSGKRLSSSSFDEVSTWKVGFVTPDYEKHTATVSVVAKGDQFYAWYSGKDHELPARAVQIDGDQVTLKLSAETRDGAKVDLTFRGNVTGNTVKGNAEYELEGDTGSFPFTAKRAS